MIDPDTGRSLDDIGRTSKRFDWLTAAGQKKIFEDNARKVFNLKV